jgi:hypothetical protein
MSRTLPRGAQQIVESLRAGVAWQGGPVVVSFTGHRAPRTAFETAAQHVFPAAGASHDWRWINGLRVWIIAAAGAGDAEAMAEIAWRCHPYAGIVDTGIKAVGHLIDCYGPGDTPRVWHEQVGGLEWAAWFGGAA